MKTRKAVTGLITLFTPKKLKPYLLNLLGHKVHPSVRIGFSLVLANRIYMDEGSSIGNLNLLEVNKLLMRKGAFIKKKNRIRGPINLLMRKKAAIANDNSIYRAKPPICFGISTLKLGELGQLISKNHLDVTKSIEIGDNTTIGGLGGQFWTHGFFHSRTGPGRIRVDGPIKIGHNVYVGSRCTFNPGVIVADGIFLGSNVCVSKSLKIPGMYVSQPLRHIDRDLESIKTKLTKAPKYQVAEVYEKTLN